MIAYPFEQVIITPKSFLRHPMALSSFKDMEPGTSFRPILPDPFVKPGAIEKVLICSGKVYYDVISERQGKKLEDKIAIIRVEQYCPFPYHLFAEEMAKYPNAKVKIDLCSFFRDSLKYSQAIPVFLGDVVARRAQKSRGVLLRERQDSVSLGKAFGGHIIRR